MVEDKISVVTRIRPEWGQGQVEWVKNGERNIMRRDGTEIYTFDAVFDQVCSNAEIYERVMSGIVESALAGFNTAVCAYGQSGAGKTHTLTGSDSEDGIVQCTFEALFDAIAKSKDRNYMLRISYVEIYNERVRDLLSESVADLPIYENKDGVAQIEGLKDVVVTEKAEVESLLATAQDHRQLGETLLNERSSRSHTIIRITIESHDAKFGGNATRCSIMNLVDLAGSENAASAGTQGLRQKEGANINKSLLALSKVVSSLADNQRFIPYRDSKLTRILKPSLGGNSKTVIICCVAPFSLSETNSTLKFAKQAKKIITRPVVNEATDDGLLSKYLREIELLRSELEKTKKENNEEERSREQRAKLAELMKGILNGRESGEVSSALSRKARRQTWAPGNRLMGLTGRRSMSPPCKKERVLFAIDEPEVEGRKSDEGLQDDSNESEESNCAPAAGDAFAIPKFVPSRPGKKIEHAEVEVQTCYPYPVDRTDEVLTLKKGNSSLVDQLATKTKRCIELEKQKEECAVALASLKNAVARLQEVEEGAVALENRLEDTRAQNKTLADENRRLKEEIASLKVFISENETTPIDRERLLGRIDDQYDENCKLKEVLRHEKSRVNSLSDEKEILGAAISDLQHKIDEAQCRSKTVQHEFDNARKQWMLEREDFIGKLERITAENTKNADTIVSELRDELRQLKAELAVAKKRAEDLEISKASELAAAEKKFRVRFSKSMEDAEEEIKQLRKDNADLSARITNLLSEQNPPCNSTDEALALQEEVAELKEVIERKCKALEVAEKHGEELKLANITVERLSREKKELSNQLKIKADKVEMLCSRVNVLRDEINEKQSENKKLLKDKEEVESTVQKLEEDNVQLKKDIGDLRDKYRSHSANMESIIEEKERKISALIEQSKDDKHKILLLDTDLAIAVKDVERYKNTISSMAKAQDESRSKNDEEQYLKEQLNGLLTEMAALRNGKERVEDALKTKDKMLTKAMDTITKLETEAQSSLWVKEKARLQAQIQDLERQVRDANEITSQQRPSRSSERQFAEERKELCEEILRLRDELTRTSATSSTSSVDSQEREQLKKKNFNLVKELGECKDKILRYRKQKNIGLEYVAELKTKIKTLESELDQQKKSLTEKTKEIEELQRALEAKAELESGLKENVNARAKGGAFKPKEQKVPLEEQPECKPQ
ncbi:hypothetical protein Q1695_005560 [Nippostrongylus brasiliensis]|nr:hypothetical protein Q1695_005560 [Nippostrongylus brasiliensis]